MDCQLSAGNGKDEDTSSAQCSVIKLHLSKCHCQYSGVECYTVAKLVKAVQSVKSMLLKVRIVKLERGMSL